MKAVRTRTALAGVVLGAGLVLSACGGGGDSPTSPEGSEAEQDGGDQADSADSAEAPAAEEDLVAALESGGYAAQSMDPAEFAEAQSTLGDMEVDPAECEGVMGTGLADIQDSDVVVVTGTPEDPAAEPIAAAIGYPSAEEAVSTVETSKSALGSCGDVTVTTQGMELSSSTSMVSADVEGADTVHATESTIDMSDQEIATRSLIVQKGSVLVSLTASDASGMEGADFDELSEKATGIIATLP